jgi:hypothetical protein
LSLLKALAKIVIVAAIPAPIAKATFHNTHGSFFFKQKKFTSRTTLCLIPCEEFFYKNFLKKGPIGVGYGGCLGYGG